MYVDVATRVVMDSSLAQVLRTCGLVIALCGLLFS